MGRSPFPLQWPQGWPRAKSRGTPKFSSRFVEDRDAIIRRLGRRGSNVIITSNLPVNRFGLPTSAGTDDPGIAVYWSEPAPDGGLVERVIAIDRWHTASNNMRAIAKSLEALDGIKRWGADTLVERSFGSFLALPPGSASSIGASSKRPWREVLGGTWPELMTTELLDLAQLRYKRLIAIAHPDRGGDPVVAAELNAAIEDAERELVP